MKTENLSVGLIVKNYKKMCEVTEEDIKTGKSKQLQLKDWKRYFDFDTKGHTFIIKEVFEVPKHKDKTANNSKYIEEIKDILVDYIYTNRDDEGKVTISFSKLINILGMVNDTYSIANSRKRELSDILNIDLKAVYYFYNNTRSELKNIVERALNNLKNRSVIHYNSIVMIAEKVDKSGKKLEYRKADSDEVIMILDTQRMVLEELGIEGFQELFLSGNAKYKQFSRMLMLELPYEWKFFFNAYEIISGEYSIKSEFNISKRKKELNLKSSDRMTVLLKAKEENTNEKKLIDVLISLVEHDFKLDDQIKELYEERRDEKNKKLMTISKEIVTLKEKESDLFVDIDVTKKVYDERDAINKRDFYNYSKQVSKREDIFEVSEYSNEDVPF